MLELSPHGAFTVVDQEHACPERFGYDPSAPVPSSIFGIPITAELHAELLAKGMICAQQDDMQTGQPVISIDFVPESPMYNLADAIERGHFKEAFPETETEVILACAITGVRDGDFEFMFGEWTYPTE